MSTLKKEDYDIMKQQILNAEGEKISKQQVLRILHEKLEEVDLKNEWIVDRIDGEAIKDVLNAINKLSC